MTRLTGTSILSGEGILQVIGKEKNAGRSRREFGPSCRSFSALRSRTRRHLAALAALKSFGSVEPQQVQQLGNSVSHESDGHALLRLFRFRHLMLQSRLWRSS